VPKLVLHNPKFQYSSQIRPSPDTGAFQFRLMQYCTYTVVLPFMIHFNIVISSMPRSKDGAVGIATGYRLDKRKGRSSSPVRVKQFLFSTSPKPALGPTQPPIQLVSGALSPGIKRPGREADRSPLTSAEVKKMWVYTSTPPYFFMA
jgi:hypothetical protein